MSPIVRTSKSYIQDTSDFLRKLGDLKDIPSKASLVTLDVCSLYTNIPNLEGLNAAYDALGALRDESAKPSNLSLMELLNLVLTLNNFQFKYRLKPLAWYRYIDDVFCIWQHGDIELNNFVEHLNNTHDTIKFSMETSKVEISFLDTMVKLDNGEIITDLYCKPTDRNNYLPFNSAHPYHCKKGLPYGQFLRLRRICSRDEDFLTQSAKKAALLLQKQYPMELLINSYLKAQAKERVDLLQPKGNQGSEEKESAIFLTTTYNPAYNGLPNQVRKTWDLSDRSSSTRDLHSLTLKVGLRRPKNLRDILVKSKLQTPGDETGTKKKARTTGKITSKVTGRKYHSRTKATCNSNNIVYCISCCTCGKQYVGQTKNSVKKWFQVHFYQIAHEPQKTEVSRHFNQRDHHKLADVEISVLSFVHQGPDSEAALQMRLRLEFDWIHRLRSQIPLGLNSIDSMY